MLFRGVKHRRTIGYLVGPIIILIFIILEFKAEDKPQTFDLSKLDPLPPSNDVQDPNAAGVGNEGIGAAQQVLQAPVLAPLPVSPREVYSVSTADRKYFHVDFDQYASNPSIISHPTLDDTWILTAQKETTQIQNYMWFTSVTCNAKFKKGILRCLEKPTTLKIPASVSPHCTGPLKYYADSVGPHEVRLFYGPKTPHIVYGSNSGYTCFGQWIVDFRTLADSGFERIEGKEFLNPTELQKPARYRSVEKNWFIFWDRDGQIYTHYEIWPNRGFAQLAYDGSVGPDLAARSYASDSKCMARFMPRISQELDPRTNMPTESLHQATNSLSITLCGRSEPWCAPDNSNTFIMTVFHHKTYKQSHSVYEPYIMLFRQKAPFEVHAITTEPFWISGRGGFGWGRKPSTLTPEESSAWTQTEMLRITSISWKSKKLKYHGFTDDVIMISFGIEDSRSAAIDVRAGDLTIFSPSNVKSTILPWNAVEVTLCFITFASENQPSSTLLFSEHDMHVDELKRAHCIGEDIEAGMIWIYSSNESDNRLLSGRRAI